MDPMSIHQAKVVLLLHSLSHGVNGPPYDQVLDVFGIFGIFERLHVCQVSYFQISKFVRKRMATKGKLTTKISQNTMEHKMTQKLK